MQYPGGQLGWCVVVVADTQSNSPIWQLVDEIYDPQIRNSQIYDPQIRNLANL